MASSNRSTAVTVVCLGVAALAVFAAVNSDQVASSYAQQFPDVYGTSRAQLRFAPLMEKVPEDASVGYITDLDLNSTAHATALMAAQYALAPRQIMIGQKPELAVGNFSKPQDYSAAGAAQGYEVAADLGNGVVLFRRKAF